MTVNTPPAVFTDAGFPGTDTRHISLRVYEVADTQSGQFIMKKKVFIEGGDGNFTADNETRFVFGIVEEGWEFKTFDQGGKSWPGIAVSPDSGDFEVSSNDPTKRTVVMLDKCTNFCLHRYQIVLRNPATGEIATTDPSVENVDRERGNP